MALIVIGSVKGSPGVTTTAVGMWHRWGSPVLLVEADVSGSSILAGFLGGQVPAERGLYQLAQDYDPTGTRPLEISAQTMAFPDERYLLPGVTWAPQAASVAPMWADLAEVLTVTARAGMDVLVDMGRILLPHDTRSSLLAVADLVVVCAGSSLPDLYSLGELADRLGAVRGGAHLGHAGLLVIGEGRPYSLGDLSAHAGLPVVATIPHDPAGARRYSQGTDGLGRRGRRFEDAMAVAAGTIQDHTARRRAVAGGAR